MLLKEIRKLAVYSENSFIGTNLMKLAFIIVTQLQFTQIIDCLVSVLVI